MVALLDSLPTALLSPVFVSSPDWYAHQPGSPNQALSPSTNKKDRISVWLDFSPIPFHTRVFRVRQRRVFWLLGLHPRSFHRPSHSCGTAPDSHRLPPNDLASGPMVTAAETLYWIVQPNPEKVSITN
jgi:hypothetical protein